MKESEFGLFISKHERRRLDSIEIAQLGPLVAATTAFTDYKFGVPVEGCIRERDRALTHFENCPRGQRISMIIGLQYRSMRLAKIMSPGCDETESARISRRFTLIQQIIRAGIAEGSVAVQAVDLVMGRFSFDLSGNQLYHEWRERRFESVRRDGVII